MHNPCKFASYEFADNSTILKYLIYVYIQCIGLDYS